MKRPPDAAAMPPGFGPIGYFENHCARCHGPYGAFYGDEFAASLDGDHLRDVVQEMVFGAAQSSLEDPEIDLLTAYHRSMAAGEPFVVVTTGMPELAGEVTPGATVRVQTAEGQHDAAVEGHRWRLPGVTLDRASSITAEIDGRATRIDPRSTVGSHR